MQKNELIRIIPKRQEILSSVITAKNGGIRFGENTVIEVVDTKIKYLNEIKQNFDLPKIKKFLSENEVFLSIDCLNSPISNYLLPILEEIGLDETCLLNFKLLEDFGGKTPSTGKNKNI